MATKAPQPQAPFDLVVIHPFGDYERGQRITDTVEIQTILDSENAHHCNRAPKQ